jgi:hypothetical protein
MGLLWHVRVARRPLPSSMVQHVTRHASGIATLQAALPIGGIAILVRRVSGPSD